MDYTLTANPFSILTVVVAPAVLTNASSVLALGTNNRLPRVANRTHAVTAQLAKLEPGTRVPSSSKPSSLICKSALSSCCEPLAASIWVSDSLPARRSSRSPVRSRCITAEDQRSRRQPELVLYAEPPQSSHSSARVS
jgi:hypothetical protein